MSNHIIFSILKEGINRSNGSKYSREAFTAITLLPKSVLKDMFSCVKNLHSRIEWKFRSTQQLQQIRIRGVLEEN